MQGHIFFIPQQILRVYELYDKMWYVITLSIPYHLTSTQIETVEMLAILRDFLSLVWFLANKISVCLGGMRKIHTLFVFF